MNQRRTLVRIPAREVVPGDRMGSGRWQGVQVVQVGYWPTLGGEHVKVSLGSHGWIELRPDEPVLVERAVPAPAKELS